jgi:hypothetical protein
MPTYIVPAMTQQGLLGEMIVPAVPEGVEWSGAPTGDGNYLIRTPVPIENPVEGTVEVTSEDLSQVAADANLDAEAVEDWTVKGVN